MSDPRERLKTHEEDESHNEDEVDDLFDSITAKIGKAGANDKAEDNDAIYGQTSLDDDDDDAEALIIRQVKAMSLTPEEDAQVSLLELQQERAKEQQNSNVSRGFNRAAIAASRAYPLGALVPLKKFEDGTWNDPWLKHRHDAKWEHAKLVWETPRWAPGSITCIVQKPHDPHRYILTVGHAFYDIDMNRRDEARFLPGGNTKQTNELDYSWGEPDLIELAKLDPVAKSEGKYYRMGDKFGSKVDCGLAKLNLHDKTGARLRWSNVYVINAQKQKRLVGLDVWPIPAEVKQLVFHWWEKPLTEFIVCNEVVCTFTNYKGEDESILERVLIRPRDYVEVKEGKETRREYHYNGSPVQSGASGSAIIRGVPGTNDAYVVGLALGFCTIKRALDVHGKLVRVDTKATYDIFQHVSVAQTALGLSQVLPQPE